MDVNSKLERFINKAKKVHGDKYDYSKVEYVNSQTKVCIICPKHGEFWQEPSAHIRGHECPLCANLKRGSRKRFSIKEFIEKARKIHGNKYNYSKAKYINALTPITIICPEHGEFKQIPMNHLLGQGCPKCAGKGLTQNEIIKMFRKIHGDKYDYSKVVFTKMHEKVCIICPEHGEFWQTPSKHLLGQGCPKCAHIQAATKKRTPLEYFIKKANKIHNNKYNYSKVKYNSINDLVTIICPEHGEFKQRVFDHLNWHGCPKCAIEESRLKKEEFIERASKIHNNKYDYSKVELNGTKEAVCIICPKHGEFWQKPEAHLKGCGCPICGHETSKAEFEIYSFVKKELNGLIVENRNRNILDKKELDIFIPHLKLAIEYNGIKWHSTEFHDDVDFHLNKLKECNKKGIQLIQIFEDEWLEHKEIVLSKLKHIIGKDYDLPKIYARKCKIKEINNSSAKEFLENNHIQGFAKSTIYVGCFYNSKLVGVMSFLKENNKGDWNLTRFATDNNYVCSGVGGKLLKYFESHFFPKRIKTFADRRWTTDLNNNLYTKLGFKLTEIEKPDYRYFCPKLYDTKRIHKFNFRKQLLHKKFGFPLTMTEAEMAKQLKAYKIYDCGLAKYEKIYNDEYKNR